MIPRTITVALLAAVALSLAVAAPVMASEQIESFVTTMTDPQGEGPTPRRAAIPTWKRTSRSKIPATPRRPKTSPSTPRRACSATSTRSPTAPPRTSPSINARQLPARPDHGTPTTPVPSRHGAPLRHLPQADQTALIEFIVPTLDIPIAIPITVRTATDYGLRFKVSDITQLTPLAARQPDDLGLPRRSQSQRRPVRQGLPGQSAGCPGLADASCITVADESEHSQQAVHRQPDPLQRP